MTFEEVKKYLEENKETEEIKSYLDSFKVNPTLEVFKDLVTSDSNFMSFMDSEKDKHLSKGLETFKTNNLQKLIDEKVKELYPEEDPKDSEMKKLQQKIEQMEKDSRRKELTNLALKKVTEKKLPTDLIELLVASDEESTLNNIESFEKVFGERIESMISQKMKDNAYEPPANNTKFDNITKDDFFKMDFAEQQKFAEEKPDAYKSIME